MKLELTLELKERFFAQYWGQKVLQKENTGSLSEICGVTQQLMDCSPRHLLLRPFSSMTDEEAIEITNIHWPGVPILDKVDQGRWFVRYLIDRSGRFGDLLLTIDYLRSKGFAIPFMGYSVEELVEVGWVRLAEL